MVTWETKTLGELFDITSSKRVFQSEWRSEGVPFYRARELAVLSETGSVDNELFISREMYDTYTRQYGAIQPADILITGVGTLGKVYVVKEGDEFYFKDGNIIWLRSQQKVDSDFVRQLYFMPFMIDQVIGTAAGSTVGTYTITNAKATIIPVPPHPEQRSIATALSAADAYISALEKLIDKKYNIKQGAMQELLSGKRRIPGFEGEWNRKPLLDCCDLLQGLTYSPNNVKSFGLLVMRSSNIKNSKLVFDDCVYVNCNVDESKYVKTSDILICVRNGSSALIGKSCVIDQNYNATFGAFMSVLRGDDTGYIAHIFTSDIVQEQIRNKSNATINQITKRDFEDIVIPTPPTLAEQTAIASILSDMDTEIDKLTAKLEKARCIKQGMMSELLTGRIRLIMEDTHNGEN